MQNETNILPTGDRNGEEKLELLEYDVIRKPSAMIPDPEYDTDLESTRDQQAYDITGKKLYIHWCQKLGVIPVTYFTSRIECSSINLSHHGLGPIGTMAICFPLQSNTRVTHLNLSNNFIGPEGAAAVCWMLQENVYITSLNLSGNKLGSAGFKHIYKVVYGTVTITDLNISRNQLTDNDGVQLASCLLENKCLTRLNVSGNEFASCTALALGPALIENDNIADLDLSWNFFGYKDLIPICKSLKKNATLQVLNLSFLGMSKQCCKALEDGLKENRTLLKLYANHSRMGADGANHIARLLLSNTSLQTLEMVNNNIGVPAAINILNSLLKNTSSVLTNLDFGFMEVTKQYVEVETAVMTNKPITIKRGQVLEDFIIKGIYLHERTMLGLKIPDFQETCPLTALKNFAESNNINIYNELVDYIVKKNLGKMQVSDIVDLVSNAEFGLTFDQQRAYECKVRQLADNHGLVDVSIFLPPQQ